MNRLLTSSNYLLICINDRQEVFLGGGEGGFMSAHVYLLPFIKVCARPSPKEGVLLLADLGLV